MAKVCQKGTLINEHFSAIEKTLLAAKEIQETVGHSLHKGTPREAFVRGFLQDHIGTRFGIGTGEIIDCLSKSKAPRNQIDIVVYDDAYPRLSLGGGISSFLIESVRATIEVKSTLTKEDLINSAIAGENIKNLVNLPGGERLNLPPRRFVVAYSGPKNIDTVFGWLVQHYKNAALHPSKYSAQCESYAHGEGEIPREVYRSSTLDGIFILGMGFVLFDGFSFTLGPVYANPKSHRNLVPIQWSYGSCATGALHLFFWLYAVSSGI